MYGILMPYEWHREWEAKTGKDFYGTFEKYMEDRSYEEITKHKEGIFCLFDGRDGRYIIIGRVLQRGDEDQPFLGENRPYKVPLLEDYEQVIIEDAVFRHFDLQGEFNYYFVTHYK